ncbi:uncharacterized protein JN550_008504 [Neoarthrinium moseri]|uniref:uncharacterized protein n=1 Tax=Neoarthrinium moseri TaxID=1658444 RepID=UPI001FDD2069|nr:uncharacterized protein JN550_008504 [Neoarthrinium moseri]KAI1864958.1 hypothetical protein JN550_008504 [Neoarthrinium moseri]
MRQGSGTAFLLAYVLWLASVTKATIAWGGIGGNISIDADTVSMNARGAGNPSDTQKQECYDKIGSQCAIPIDSPTRGLLSSTGTSGMPLSTVPITASTLQFEASTAASTVPSSISSGAARIDSNTGAQSRTEAMGPGLNTTAPSPGGEPGSGSEKSNDGSGGGGLSTGARAGIGVGAAIGGIGVLGGVALFFYRAGRRVSSSTEHSNDNGFGWFAKPELADTQFNGYEVEGSAAQGRPNPAEIHELEARQRTGKLEHQAVPVEIGVSERDELQLRRQLAETTLIYRPEAYVREAMSSLPQLHYSTSISEAAMGIATNLKETTVSGQRQNSEEI